MGYLSLFDGLNAKLGRESSGFSLCLHEMKKVKIYSGKDRSIAVMIDNHKSAWPQAGLNQAYLVYEIIVEGGETRLMPVFKGVDLKNLHIMR